MVKTKAARKPGLDAQPSLDLGTKPSELLGSVLKELQRGQLADYSVRRMTELMVRFTTYLEKGHRISSVGDIAEDHAEGFVFASVPGRGRRRRPAPATTHLRRSALRLYFRTARELGVAVADPTIDLALPPRSSRSFRALTDDEVALCRSFSLKTPTATRLPAAWALAEATARTSEIPHICKADLDLEDERAWLHGSPKTEARWGRLSAWGVTQLERRTEQVESADGRLAYNGTAGDVSAQAASCVAITEVLERAGLAREPDVRPLSVVAWAGTKVLEQTGRIDAVAHALGMRSLDRAAKLIGWDWNDDHGERRAQAS